MAWMFAYGHQMGEGDRVLLNYDPQPARLAGYHRAFNHVSTDLFGDEANPCPIVGLSPGGETWGLAFEVPWSEKKTMLRRMEPPEARKQCRRKKLRLELSDGDTRKAHVWLSRPEYAETERWSGIEELESALVAAHGKVGRGVEYVRAVAQALERWELQDPLIDELWERLAAWRPR